ncbi:MAG: cation:proton antiporter [bacterium]|nr:cation:proton antiporter [bacterium]
MKLFITSLAITFSLLLSTPSLVFAASDPTATEDPHHAAFLFLAIAGILIAAKVLHLIEKIKLPPVVGELIAGIFLGNLVLIGVPFFHDFQDNEIIRFLAELGVIILLFQIGLESNVARLLKVGTTAGLVAVIGAFVPMALGAYLVGPLLIPGQSQATYLFLGASLAATSVGITARIFKDLGKMQTKAAQIVLGAAVMDDIIGLIILAIVSSLALGGTVTALSIGFIVMKSFLFLVLSVVIGQLLAPYLSHVFVMINTGYGTKFTLAISFGLIFAAIASLIGLEPIIGAFSAGLVLDPVHFKRFKEPHLVQDIKNHISDLAPATKSKITEVLNHHTDRSVEEIIEPLALFFVPIFFVTTGMSVNIGSLLDPRTIGLSLVLTVVAILGKMVAALPVKGSDRLTVGLAMIPRGEVGLIFAAIGQSLGVLSPEIFSVIVLTVLLTTIIGPFLLSKNLQQQPAATT